MRNMIQSMLAAALLFGSGCGAAPDTRAEQNDLVRQADDTLYTMVQRDPSLQALLNDSAGYAVFPNIGKGGALVGGAHGNGIVYVDGQPDGFVELNQASIGAQLGGASFAELIVFRTPEALARLQDGGLTTGASQANASFVRAGAAGSTDVNTDIATFVMAHGGLLADASFAGQRIEYVPMRQTGRMAK